MNVLRRFVLVTVLTLLVVSRGFTQQEQGRPQVAFAVSAELQLASPSESGSEGVSRFASIFSQLGADILSLEMGNPVPGDIDVLVLVGPRRPLALRDTVNLYEFLQRGGRLLLALDPDGYAATNLNTDNIGIDQLFLNDYGVTFQTDLLVEPWFTLESLSSSNLAGAHFRATPEDIIPHPITQPLLQYDLPLQLWGGRSLIVEPFGVDSFGSALLYDDTVYGETANRLFRNENADPLLYNPDEDLIGRLPIGGIGINTTNNATLVLLGDGESLQNGFGLEFVQDSIQPLYPGNFLFAERLAAWLLNIPPANYPGLPAGFTWVAVDGVANPATDLTTFPTPTSNNDIAVAAVFNDHYLYARVEADSPPQRITFSIPTPNAMLNGAASPAGVQVNGVPLPDAAFAANAVVEMRLPLRIFGDEPQLLDVCLEYANETRCQQQTIRPTQLTTIDPVPLRINEMPFGTITSTELVNLRTGPDTSFDVAAIISPGVQVAIIGTDPTQEWLFVRTGAFEGWVASFLVPNNTDIATLDVIDADE